MADPTPVTSVPTLVDRFLAKFRSEVGNLVSHAVTLGSGYVVIAHTDFTKLETAVTGAIAVGVGALINKLRTSVKL